MKKILIEKMINEMDFGYLKEVLKSKLRGALSVFGLIDPSSKLLQKYPELMSMYERLLGGAMGGEEGEGETDPTAIETEFRQFIAAHPGFKEEMKAQIEKNIFDLSPEYLKGSLELMSDIVTDEVEKQKVEELLARYEESGEDVKILRQGLQALAAEELAKLTPAANVIQKV